MKQRNSKGQAVRGNTLAAVAEPREVMMRVKTKHVELARFCGFVSPADLLDALHESVMTDDSYAADIEEFAEGWEITSWPGVDGDVLTINPGKTDAGAVLVNEGKRNVGYLPVVRESGIARVLTECVPARSARDAFNAAAEYLDDSEPK